MGNNNDSLIENRL